MIMKSLSLVIVVFILVFMAEGALDFNNLQIYVQGYNNKIENAPPVLRSLLGNENIDFTIFLNNGNTVRWGIELESGMIVRSANGGLQNPTIEVYSTENAINKVLAAEDPMAAYKEAEKAGEMRIEGKTFGANIKIVTALSFGGVINPFLHSLMTENNPPSSAHASVT
jgi:hypothetical protein